MYVPDAASTRNTYTSQFYASLLAIIEVSVKRRWSTVVAKHLNVLLIATLFVYVYRDIFPLITYHRVPLDIDEGWILWAKMITLCIAAAIVPLFIPRQYIPVDPKVNHTLCISKKALLIPH
jgi:hypothetical protein